jgi:hypothetical protein
MKGIIRSGQPAWFAGRELSCITLNRTGRYHGGAEEQPELIADPVSAISKTYESSSSVNDHQAESWPGVDPEFDGHLAKPILQMTVAERLEWAWQMMVLHDMATKRRTVRPNPPRDPEAC